jgi:hypothetical protein
MHRAFSNFDSIGIHWKLVCCSNNLVLWKSPCCTKCETFGHSTVECPFSSAMSKLKNMNSYSIPLSFILNNNYFLS